MTSTSEGHNVSAHGTLGALSLAYGSRHLNHALPSGVRALMRAGLDNPRFLTCVKSYSEFDQVKIIDALATNLHEVSHYHQLLGSIAGLVCVETSYRISGIKSNLLTNNLDTSFPIFYNSKKRSILKGMLQDSQAELSYLAKGTVCFSCSPDFMPAVQVNLSSFQSEKFPHLDFLATKDFHLIFPRVIWGDDGKFNWLGFVPFMESFSFEVENSFREYVYEIMELDKKERNVGWEYKFLKDLLPNAKFPNLLKEIDLPHMVKCLSWSSMNCTSADGRNNPHLAIPGLKFDRSLKAINELDSFSLESLDSSLAGEHKYLLFSECSNTLKTNANKKIAGRSANPSLHELAMLGYYKNQIDFLNFFESGTDLAASMCSSKYLEIWGLLPKPPFTYVFTDTTPPKKIVMFNEHAGGVSFLCKLYDDIVDQALYSSCIECPLKKEKLSCPYKDEKCGSVSSLDSFSAERSCSFEYFIDDIKKGGSDMELLRHLSFIEELDHYSTKLDRS